MLITNFTKLFPANVNFYYATYQSPIGQIIVKGNEFGVSSVSFSDDHIQNQVRLLPIHLQEAVEQLHEYFCHQRKDFDLVLNVEQGQEFEHKVWYSLLQVKWGETVTYNQLAERIGKPHAIRAVGYANSLNPYLIVLPCHRVIGSTGLFTGYAGGLLRKQWLLQHEQQSLQMGNI